MTEAKGDFVSESSNLKSCKLETADDDRCYIPGFHIFLNKEDAQNYCQEKSVLVKVKFRGVLAFGKDQTNTIDKPCIIASHMKIVKEYHI